MLPDKPLFIIGSGASATADVPTTKGFEDEVPRIITGDWCDKLEDPIQAFGGDESLFLRYTRAFEQWMQYPEELNIEEYYQSLQQRVASGDDGKEQIDDLKYLIGKTIALKGRKYVHRIRTFEEMGEEPPTHVEFVKRFSRFDTPIPIITTNWDILLEWAFRSLGLTYRFAGDLRMLSGQGTQGLDGSKILTGDDPTYEVLKIHGSLDWHRCPRCAGVEVTGAESANELWELDQIPPGPAPCQKCHPGPEQRALFIPPGGEKNREPKDPLLQAQWYRARNVLHADMTHLVVIGYSFPEGDQRFQTMVREAIDLSRHLKRLVVVTAPVDDAQARENRIRDVTEIYHEMFPIERSRIDVRPDGFAGWVKEGCPLL